MNKFQVKLTGPDNNYPERATLKVGDSVKLYQDANNKFSQNAVQVATTDNRVLGFVAENVDAKHQTKSSKELYVSFGQSDYVTGIVVKELGMSRGCTQFLIDVNINPMTNQKQQSQVDTDTLYVEMTLGGARLIYKELTALTADIALNGSSEQVTIVAEGDKLIAEYNNGKAGLLKETDSSTMFVKDGEDFLPSVENKRIENELLHRMVSEFGQEGTVFEGTVLLDGTKLITYVKLPKSIREEAIIRFGVGEVISRVVKENILSEKEAKEILSVMQDSGFDEDLIKRSFATMVKYEQEAMKLIPKKPETLFIGPELVEETMFYATLGKGQHLLFEGAKGLGKNHLSEQIAWMLQRPLLELPINSELDNSTLFGNNSVKYDEKGNMSVGFDPEVLIRGAEMGAIVVADEMNTGLASILSGANGLWDSRRRISVPGYKTIVAHPNFITIATINPGYMGTDELNEATAERFVPIVFETDVKIDKIIKSHFPKINKRNLDLMKKTFDDMQKLVRDGRIEEKSITIRGFLVAAEATLNGKKLHKAMITNVAHRARDLDDRKTLKNLIQDNIGNE